MSDRTLNELANAEIVPDAGGSNSYMVRFGENEYDTVNKSAKHVLILEDDVLAEDVVSYGGIMVEFNLETDTILLSDGDNELEVPSDQQEGVLWSVHDEDGARLQRIFDDLYTPTVRQGLMDMFLPRFRESKEQIRKTDDGWVIDSILVAWDASNHPMAGEDQQLTIHVVSGDETVPADTDKEARDISFPVVGDDGTKATAPHGQTYTLNEVEAQFLATASIVVDNDAQDLYDDELADFIEGSYVSSFTDEKSGLFHSHPPSKHRVQDLGVTDEAADKLWSNDNDHTGVVEMAMRESEFSNAPFDVFEDAPNDDSQTLDAREGSDSEAHPVDVGRHVRGITKRLKCR